MKTTIKYICTGLSLCACTCLVNNLPADKYQPDLKIGWEALTRAVETNGKLGWVQPVGADPKKVTRDMTELYGTGAFLMAASEIYKLADK